MDSDSPGDAQSESVIRISVAQSIAKLHVLQPRKCQNRLSPESCGILTIALQQSVVLISSNGKKVLELIITQALEVSNNLVKVVYIVSQVPWNYPIIPNSIIPL